jgi:uncharacterized protein (DUF1810 family)
MILDHKHPQPDPFHLARFFAAQQGVFERVLDELRSGRKKSHWMWYIFPQIDGLGRSETARYYAIKSFDEARAYLAHPLLGARLVECCETILALTDKSASELFGFPDDMKLKSCITLFAAMTEGSSVFSRVLDKYFDGKPDRRTIDLLGCDK